MIDEGLTGDWPPEVIEAAKKFQQGDLIVQPPIVYAASLRSPIWELTRVIAEDAGDPDAAPAHLAVDGDEVPPYGIITSQTCDVAEDRPVPVQPWIDIAPVYTCDESNPLLGRDYVFRLDSMQAPDGKRWVADLRLSIPLEKGLLVRREPIDPFGGSEKERIAFGDALGKRLARAALSESVHKVIGQTLRSHNRSAKKRVRKRVYKLMLHIAQGTRLEPEAVRLHVVTLGSPDVESNREMREWFETWWDGARTIAELHDVNLLAPAFHDSTNMDVALYDELVELRDPLH